jgi:hypothetical protein
MVSWFHRVIAWNAILRGQAAQRLLVLIHGLTA